MKKIISSLLFASLLFSMYSCLDENPLYTQNNEVIFSTEDNVELALLGCYAYLAGTNAYGQHWQEVPIVGAGVVSWAQRSGSDGLASLNTLSSDGLVSTAWSGMYKVVSEVNAFLFNLQGSGMPDSIKTVYGNEAKFLRAFAYYNLVSAFGDVPLKVEASTSDGIDAPRAPKEEVFSQIVSDLADAQNIGDRMQDGRVCSWTVKAFMGKVYHKMAALGIDAETNWQNAKICFDDVYANGPFALESNFYDLFTDWKLGSPESIFQINFSLTSSACFNRASNRFAPQASTTGVNWSTYRSTQSAYDLHEGTYPGDPRIDATFLTRWRARGGNSQANPKDQVGDQLSANDSVYTYPYMTYTVKLNTAANNSGKAEYDSIGRNGVMKAARVFVAKMPYDSFSDRKNPDVELMENWPDAADQTDPYAVQLVSVYRNVRKTFAESNSVNQMPAFAKTLYDQEQQGTASHKNLMVFRYAEMLLLMADVYNEIGQQERAVELANEVLARARKSYPPASGARAWESAQPADWDLTLSQEEIREKLYFERILELNGEPSIYEMMRVRGADLFAKILEFNNDHRITRLSDAFYYESPGTNKWCERVYNGGDLTDDFITKNLLLPIPDSELNANAGITENNFGY